MRHLYTLAILLYTAAVRLAALLGHQKARLLARGWKQWPQTLANLNPHTPVVWFHAASLGEFEQARPLIEAYRHLHPDHQILLTFFSPSGYQIRKDYPLANAVAYLPPDTPRNARRFIAAAHPSSAFFVKYEFWYNHLRALRLRHVPTYLFSAIFRPNQYFFQPYGRWFLRQLSLSFTHLFVQNTQSLQLLHRHHIQHCSLAGDTRFDRVHQIASSALPDPVVERFLSGHHGHVLVAGSTWPPDEQILARARNAKPNWFPSKTIIAPHLVDRQHILQIQTLFPDSVTYSQLSAHTASPDHNVLIVDNIGLLSKLYRYASIAYIGGGFGNGIHNILEALAFGKPVLFGPNYHKFQEAIDAISLGAAFPVRNHLDLLHGPLQQLLSNPTTLSNASQAALLYMTQNLGSTQKILSTLEK